MLMFDRSRLPILREQHWKSYGRALELPFRGSLHGLTFEYQDIHDETRRKMWWIFTMPGGLSSKWGLHMQCFLIQLTKKVQGYNIVGEFDLQNTLIEKEIAWNSNKTEWILQIIKMKFDRTTRKWCSAWLPCDKTPRLNGCTRCNIHQQFDKWFGSHQREINFHQCYTRNPLRKHPRVTFIFQQRALSLSAEVKDLFSVHSLLMTLNLLLNP